MKEVKIKVALDAKDANKEVEKLKGTLNEIDGIDIESPFDEIYGEAKSLTQVMGGLQDRLYELAKAGDTQSKEFKVLTAETGRLRKAQIKVDRAIDATAKTLGEKLANGANMAASGYSVLQGAMGLMQMENEEVERSLQRVMSAMAMAQGVSGFADAMRNSAAATKAAAFAMRLFNTAIKANPLTAFLTVLVSVVASIKLYQEYATGSADAVDRLVAAGKRVTNGLINQSQKQKDLNTEMKDSNDEMDKAHSRELRMAEARGDSKKSIEDLRLAQADERIELAKANVAKQKSLQGEIFATYIRLQKKLGTEDLTEAEQKQLDIAKQNDTAARGQLDTMKEFVKLAEDNKGEIVFEYKLIKVEEGDTGDTTSRPKVVSSGLSDTLDGAVSDDIVGDPDPYAEDYNDFNTHIDNMAKLRQDDIDNAKRAADEKMDLDVMISQSLIQAFDVAAGLAKEGSDLQKAILISRQVAAAVELGLSIKSTIVAAKETATKVALKQAEATVDLAGGLAKTAGSSPFPANIPLIIGYAAAAAGIIGGVVSAVKTSNSVTDRYGGGSSNSNTSIAPPSFNLVQGSADSSIQESIENSSDTPIRAFVVSGDVSSAQELDRNLEDSSSI